MKRLFLIFSVLIGFCYCGVAHADATDKIYVDPQIAEKAIKKHFSHMATQYLNVKNTTMLDDSTLLTNVIDTYNDVLKQNDGFVSVEGVVNVCKAAFGCSYVSCGDSEQKKVFANKCNDFVADLTREDEEPEPTDESEVSSIEQEQQQEAPEETKVETSGQTQTEKPVEEEKTEEAATRDQESGRVVAHDEETTSNTPKTDITKMEEKDESVSQPVDDTNIEPVVEPNTESADENQVQPVKNEAEEQKAKPVNKGKPKKTATPSSELKQTKVSGVNENQETIVSSNCPYNISKVNGSQMKIRYALPDNTGFIRSNGSIAWRFFNPGNLRGSRDLQCTTIRTKPNGTFAVFPNAEIGRLALHKLLTENPGYYNATVKNAIYKYAPPNENNTTRYINNLRKAGINVDARLSDLTDAEMTELEEMIMTIEGWKKSGTETHF